MTALKEPADLVAAIERASARRVTEGDVVWHIWGTGYPLVLFHGGTGSWFHWVRNVEALARDFMVIAADLPGSGDVKPAELKMARQLIDEMTTAFKPQDFKDDFTAAIHALVAAKAKAGDKATVQPFEDAPDLGGANVVDLTELLRQSLGGKKPKAKAPARKAAAKTTRGKQAA